MVSADDNTVVVILDGQNVPMLLDSGASFSVVHPDVFLEAPLCKGKVDSILLQGAFGAAIAADVYSLQASLADQPASASSSQPVELQIAITDQLNGDLGLLAIRDFNLLQGSTSKVVFPAVKVIGNGNLLYPYKCNKVSSSHIIDNYVVQSNDIMNIVAGNKITNSNVFNLDLSAETYDKFKSDQLSDPTLIQCWKKAIEGSPEFVIDSEDSLLYRKTELSGVAIFQLVLPVSKRAVVMRAAHASSHTVHLGTKKTFKHVRAQFLAGDGSRYFQLCLMLPLLPEEVTTQPDQQAFYPARLV